MLYNVSNKPQVTSTDLTLGRMNTFEQTDKLNISQLRKGLLELVVVKCLIYCSLAPSWLGTRLESFKLDSSINIPSSAALATSFHLPFSGLQSFQPPASPKKKEIDEI